MSDVVYWDDKFDQRELKDERGAALLLDFGTVIPGGACWAFVFSSIVLVLLTLARKTMSQTQFDRRWPETQTREFGVQSAFRHIEA